MWTVRRRSMPSSSALTWTTTSRSARTAGSFSSRLPGLAARSSSREGTVAPDMRPGSLKGLQLVVGDIQAARARLDERGVAVGDIQIMGKNPTPQPDALDNVGFVFFSDHDGNEWAVQQISARG